MWGKSQGLFITYVFRLLSVKLQILVIPFFLSHVFNEVLFFVFALLQEG